MFFLLPGVLVASMEVTANCSSDISCLFLHLFGGLLKMLTPPAKCGNVRQPSKDPQAFGKSVLSLAGTGQHPSPVEQESHSSLGTEGGYI